jgi:hypothetical protein
MKKSKSKKKNLLKKKVSPIIKIFNKKRKPLLHTIEWLFILIAFFTVGFFIAYYQIYGTFLEKYAPTNKQMLIQNKEDEKKFIGEIVPETVDTTSWDTYRNQWYGFEVGHPDSWTNMQYKSAMEKSARYETIYKFRKNTEGEDDIFFGYDVVVYSIKKIHDIDKTNEIRKKDDSPEDISECSFSKEADSEEVSNQYQKVSIGDDNPCFEPAYFYSVSEGNYIYNIVPALKDDTEKFSNPEENVNKNLPEFKEAVDSFKLIPIVRPKPKPTITARRPISAKIVGGKLVCAIKNDKPHKSDNNKPGHLDLECCLDPDERPNPWCTY